MEIYKLFALSTTDGHDIDWEHFDTKEEQILRFNELKKIEDDIHIYELTDKNEYEVTDSFWIDEYKRDTKTNIIKQLVDYEVDTITNEVYKERPEYLLNMVKDGVVGFNNLSNEELIEEYSQTFDLKVILLD